MRFIKTALVLAAMTLINGNALADNNWTIGVAAVQGDGPYYDTRITFAPLVIYEKNRFTLSTLEGISYRYFNFSGNEKHEGSLSLLATPDFAPDFGDNTIYNGINRKHGLDVGMQGEYKYGVMAVEFRSSFDVSDRHNGYEITTKISYQPDTFPLELGFGARYRDNNLNQYLFGVDKSESNQTRPAFSADNSTTVFFTAMLALPVTQTLISYSQFVYEDLTPLADSPLVAQEKVTEISFGMIYQW